MIEIRKIFSIVLMLFAFNLGAINPIDPAIISYFSNANASIPASKVATSCEAFIMENSGSCNASQLNAWLKSFYVRYPLKSFLVKHELVKAGRQYLIGVYSSTNNSEFRVHLLVDGNNRIEQVRIEK